MAISTTIVLQKVLRMSSLLMKKAIEAVSLVGDLLGVVDAENELKASDVHTVGQDNYYRLQQLYSGIPVYGKTIVVSTDDVGYATALTSNFKIITDNLDLEPTINRALF